MSRLRKDLEIEKKRDLGHAGIPRKQKLQGNTGESAT